MSAAKQRYLASLARLRLEESDDSIEGIDSTDSGDSSDSLESGGSVVVSKASTVTSQGGVSAVVKASTGVVDKEVNAKSTITRGFRKVVAKRSLTVVIAYPVPANSGAPKVPSSPLLGRATASRRVTSAGRQLKHIKTSPPTHMRYLSNDSNSDSSSKRENSKSAVNKLSSSDGVRLVPTFETSQTSVTASLESVASKKQIASPVPRSIQTVENQSEHSVGGSTTSRRIEHPGISRCDSSLSPSSCKSFSSVASKQLDRLKRLAIGSVQKGRSNTSVASVAMSGKLEVRTDELSTHNNGSQSDIVSPTNKGMRTKELDRLKTLTHIHPGKYTMKGEKWRGQGRFGDAGGASVEPSKSEQVENESEGKHESRSVSQTPVSKKATFRERQLTRCSNTPTQRQSQSSEVDPSMASAKKGNKLPPVMTPPKSAILNAAAMSARCDLRVDTRNDEDVRNDSTSSTRAGRRRSRSLIHSPGITTHPFIPQRSSSSPRASPTGNSLSTKADRQTGVELCDKRGIAAKVDSVRGPSLPAPKGFKLRSPSPAPRSATVAVVAKDTRIRDVAPIRKAIYKVSKPSRLASLSIAILSQAVLPIQRLARSFLAKIAVEKRKKNILVMQSLIRRWTCIRYFHSAQTIALKCQGVYHGMVARDRLDFLHYCSVRVQSAFRGFSCKI